MPRGVEIKQYAIDLASDFAMKVMGSDGCVYVTEFTPLYPLVQWRAVPLSSNVIKVSLIKLVCVFIKLFD